VFERTGTFNTDNARLKKYGKQNKHTESIEQKMGLAMAQMVGNTNVMTELEKEAQKTVTELFEAKKIEEMLEYILIYRDSVCGDDESDKRSSNAKKLYEYLAKNKEGLLPYQEGG